MSKPGRDTQLDVPQLLTVEEVARALQLSVDQVRRQIWAGHLPQVRLGRAVRVRVEDLRTYIDSRRASA